MDNLSGDQRHSLALAYYQGLSHSEVAEHLQLTAPALAELLSAVSVVGLLEQMNGEGLAFNNGEVKFILTPKAVEITNGSAVGASLGISFAGLYESGGQLNLQGVISPIYLVNGLGQIFSRRGEGFFGFNYALSGSASAPVVSVNPLIIV